MAMAGNAHDVYLESRVLSADGVELVQILYQAALESVERARQHLRDGDIAARASQINRACAILSELTLSLDREAGGDLSQTLLELYDYMERRLIKANVKQSEPPLAEVAGLLATVLEGWMACRNSARPASENPYGASEAHEGQYVAISY